MTLEDSIEKISNTIHNRRLDLKNLYLENTDIKDNTKIIFIDHAIEHLIYAEELLEKAIHN